MNVDSWSWITRSEMGFGVVSLFLFLSLSISYFTYTSTHKHTKWFQVRLILFSLFRIIEWKVWESTGRESSWQQTLSLQHRLGKVTQRRCMHSVHFSLCLFLFFSFFFILHFLFTLFFLIIILMFCISVCNFGEREWRPSSSWMDQSWNKRSPMESKHLLFLLFSLFSFSQYVSPSMKQSTRILFAVNLKVHINVKYLHVRSSSHL